jgi:hypothetical protein
VLFDAHTPFDMSFYRAFRYPWHARPASPPAVFSSENDTGEETIVHASWNGATDVASWRVLGGASATALSARATIPDSGFESEAILANKNAYVSVQALDAAGHVIGSSPPVKTIGFYSSLTRKVAR